MWNLLLILCLEENVFWHRWRECHRSLSLAMCWRPSCTVSSCYADTVFCMTVQEATIVCILALQCVCWRTLNCIQSKADKQEKMMEMMEIVGDRDLLIASCELIISSEAHPFSLRMQVCDRGAFTLISCDLVRRWQEEGSSSHQARWPCPHRCTSFCNRRLHSLWAILPNSSNFLFRHRAIQNRLYMNILCKRSSILLIYQKCKDSCRWRIMFAWNVFPINRDPMKCR